MIRPDFHLHTTASDGVYSPEELVKLLKQADITCFSVTDHDTVSGLASARRAAQGQGLRFLPGVEISAEGEMEVHILGYGVGEENPALLSFFSRMEKSRLGRMIAMGERLERMGFPLPLDEIMEKAGKSLGRPHLARAMMAAGYITSMQEAFEKYIGRGCPAYVPREKISVSEAVTLLRDQGAVPVLAHPGLLHLPMEQFLPLLNVWQDQGLMGIEVYHPANRGEFAMWDRLARKRGMLVTGGSDFHDHNPGHGSIGETIPHWISAKDDAQALFRAAGI